MTRLLMALCLLLAALTAACDDGEQNDRGTGSAGLGGKLAGVRLQRLDGGFDSYDRYNGKVLVINVWATWCPPCRAELPSLQGLSDRLDPDRYVVIGISIDEDADFVGEFLRDTGVRYPNYLDAARAVTGPVLFVDSYPQTLLIGADRSLAERVVGVRDWQSPEVVARLESLAAAGGGGAR